MRYCFLRYPGGKAKALTLSYDDGANHDRKLIEILDRYGIKTTLNINSSLATEQDTWHLSIGELRSLVESGGHEIAIHGAAHIAPGKASTAAGINEFLECRKSLERDLDTIIRGMAYPDSGIGDLTEGVDKETIKSYLRMIGVVYARVLGGDNNKFKLPTDFLEWMPTAHHLNPNLMQYLDEFLSFEMPAYGAARTPKLFYLWGHSYEFNNANNWELLEEFCQKAGGHEEIWYATNIEICEYVLAYQSLVFDVERTKVHNPTATDVWIETDGVMHCVPAGKTVRL